MEFKLPVRPKISNKGTFGKVLNIAGSRNYSGAAFLSSVSALKIGAGLVTLATEECVIDSVSAQSPDVVYVNRNEVLELLDNYTVISIGCGLGISPETRAFFEKFLNKVKNFQKSIIIDASALQLLAETEKIEFLNNLILTPHPAEASRLLNLAVEEIVSNSEECAKLLAQKYNAIALIKGANTKIAAKDGRFYVNNTGSTALAKGGSGDVLTGIISGLIAQGMEPFEAVCLAVNLHGVTGELAAKDLTEYGVLASDLINYIPLAIKTFL